MSLFIVLICFVFFPVVVIIYLNWKLNSFVCLCGCFLCACDHVCQASHHQVQPSRMWCLRTRWERGGTHLLCVMWCQNNAAGFFAIAPNLCDSSSSLVSFLYVRVRMHRPTLPAETAANQFLRAQAGGQQGRKCWRNSLPRLPEGG